MRGGDGAFLDLKALAAEDGIRYAEDHLFEQEPEMAAGSVVSWGNVFDPIGEGGELIAFLEAGAVFLVGIINGEGVPAVFFHQGEAGHVGGAVTDINHVLKWDRAQLGSHVIIHVFVGLQHAFVDAEEILRLGGVADDAFGESDASVLILAELAAEDFFDVRRELAAVEQGLEAGGDDVVLDFDAEHFVLLGEHAVEFLKHLGQALVKMQLGTEMAEIGIGGAIHGQVVQQRLEVGEFAVVALLIDEFAALFPKLSRVDAEVREEHLVLHVVGAEGLIVVVDQTDGGLRSGHGGKRPRTMPQSRDLTSRSQLPPIF